MICFFCFSFKVLYSKTFTNPVILTWGGGAYIYIYTQLIHIFIYFFGSQNKYIYGPSIHQPLHLFPNRFPTFQPFHALSDIFQRRHSDGRSPLPEKEVVNVDASRGSEVKARTLPVHPSNSPGIRSSEPPPKKKNNNQETVKSPIHIIYFVGVLYTIMS